MSDIHALSGAYALDALDDIERARFERHLDECAECPAEVASLREAAGLMAETTPAEPSTELRHRVLEGITQVRPLPPVAAAPAAREARPRRRFRLAVGAPAAVIAGVGVGGDHTQPWSDD
jgi:anti-sigma factor RsiW